MSKTMALDGLKGLNRSFSMHSSGAILLEDMMEEKPWLETWKKVKQRTLGKHIYHKKGIKNFLTPEDFEFLWKRDKAHLLKKPSIDRIDPSKHYTLENCRYIERSLNCALRRDNKINFKIAEDIRKIKGKTYKEIGRIYKISRQFVGQIRSGKWYRPEVYKNFIN